MSGACTGCAGLYSGLSAAIARQMTYTTLRLGFFDEIKQRLARAGIQVTHTYRAHYGDTHGDLGLVVRVSCLTLCAPVCGVRSLR
jgi:hypothetical protein